MSEFLREDGSLPVGAVRLISVSPIEYQDSDRVKVVRQGPEPIVPVKPGIPNNPFGMTDEMLAERDKPTAVGLSSVLPYLLEIQASVNKIVTLFSGLSK